MKKTALADCLRAWMREHSLNQMG